MRARYTTTFDAPLEGNLDIDAAVAELPDDYVLKGMFFGRFVTALGDEWGRAQRSLEAPPERGRYHAFESYPMGDYLRLLFEVGRVRFGSRSTREAVRLLARGEVDVFADSTLGKVTFAMLRDPAAALTRYPDAVGILGQGPTIEARRVGDRLVRVTYPKYFGAIEYAVGVLEGLVLAFEEKPRLDLTWANDRCLAVDVAW